VVLLPFLALRRSEPSIGGRLIASSPPNKLDASPPDLEGECHCSPIRFLQVVVSLSAGLGGEGEMEDCLQGASVGGCPGCMSCSDRDLELKQARGCCAAAISSADLAADLQPLVWRPSLSPVMGARSPLSAK
jgi:hypothetical protein